MRFLFLNQTSYPDVVSSAQHLADLTAELAARGHEVTVLASRRAYDRPAVRFPMQETWRGVRIVRLRCTGLGKTAKWRRALDFLSFFLECGWQLPFLPRPDVVVALTSPPLISFLAASFAALRRCRFCYWIMDLNPDQAIAAGWLSPRSALAGLLQYLSGFSLRRANRIIVLDRFMRDRILGCGIVPEKVLVLPPWSHDGEVQFDPIGRHHFRLAHGLEKQFVVMYSGNHSPCHPLDTLLAAARALADRDDITFCFVGGGSEFRKLERERENSQKSLPSVVCLPYQPLEQLSASLSAADLHVVVMGDRFVGIVHPCKIYNVLLIGTPVLYIGPRPSHVTDILGPVADGSGSPGNLPGDALNSPIFAFAGHDEVARVIEHIQHARARGPRRQWSPTTVCRQFSRGTVLPLFVRALESI